MRVWVDADGIPAACKEVVLNAARKRKVPTTFVANRPLHLPTLAWVQMVVVSAGMDVADDHIAAHAKPGDLVITQDVPLAAEVVRQGIDAIGPRGQAWTEANIGERLSVRDFMTELRAGGVMTGGPPPFDDKAKRLFAGALDRWLTAGGK
jgi:uncharacterized protein YaiI (UPF0178 family)